MDDNTGRQHTSVRKAMVEVGSIKIHPEPYLESILRVGVIVTVHEIGDLVRRIRWTTKTK